MSEDTLTVHGIAFLTADDGPIAGGGAPDWAEAKVGHFTFTIAKASHVGEPLRYACLATLEREQNGETQFFELVEFKKRRFDTIKAAAEALVGDALDELVGWGRLFPTLSVIKHRSTP